MILFVFNLLDTSSFRAFLIFFPKSQMFFSDSTWGFFIYFFDQKI